MWIETFVIAITALVVTLLSTPLIGRFASILGVVDHPGGRKLHGEAKPLLGGLSLYLASMVPVLLFYTLDTRIYALVIGGTIVLVLGIIDDIYDVKPLVKLAFQGAAVAVFVGMNLGALRPILNFMSGYYVPEIVTLAAIVFWMVAMINAFNLIDGVDGLAAGTTVGTAAALAVVAVMQGNFWLMGLAMIGFGASVGFLPYNFYRAKIFMGDAGSMLVGFSLAAIFLYAVTEPFSMSVLLASGFIFAYPMVDTIYAIYRRLRTGAGIFRGDQGHIHHVLLKAGYPVPYVTLILCLANVVFAAVGVLLLSFAVRSSVVLVLGFVFVFGVALLCRFFNRVSERQVLLPMSAAFRKFG